MIPDDLDIPLRMIEPVAPTPVRAEQPLSIYRYPEFWRGALAVRTQLAGTEPNNPRRHEQAMSDLSALQLASGTGDDLGAMDSYHRWLSQRTRPPADAQGPVSAA